MTNSQLVPTSDFLFFSRRDLNDQRWGDLVLPLKLEGENILEEKKQTPKNNYDSTRFGLWGYADDEGISLNGGRTGARYAPEFIRKYFYRLAPPQKLKSKVLGDFGSWIQGPSLVAQIDLIAPLLCQQLKKFPMITLGGGHDYGAVDGAGFLQWCQQQNQCSSKATSSIGTAKPLILNFDAHLDVRPWTKGLNSGTPFSWLLDQFPNQFEFVEIGIQKHCASPEHQHWLRERQGQVLDLDYIQRVGLLTAVRQLLAGTSPSQPCFISFDIDAFSQALAPGCSQSWDAGLAYAETLETLRWLLNNKQVRLFGVYEVSPPLDLDHRTSKLAACLVDEVLRHWAT